MVKHAERLAADEQQKIDASREQRRIHFIPDDDLGFL